ncbi:MAG: UDP-2,3-diacylglucosamine diphosphatase [Candidatus Coatesbacteria bacterium]|nr:UDP-2,3-diacylglucosamine diphosphatase [Candidatus Coatesbacteria bacterium]
MNQQRPPFRSPRLGPDTPPGAVPYGRLDKTKYRAVFISDTHLGIRGANSRILLDFLYSIETDHLYLVGDIIDMWVLGQKWGWSWEHNVILRKLLSFVKYGSRVIYIPGNHDDFFRDFAPVDFGGIEIRRTADHVSAAGGRYWVLHGDDFDMLIQKHRGASIIAAGFYRYLLALNHLYNWFRRKTGRGNYSLSAKIKKGTRNYQRIIKNYELTLTTAARERGYDGVICGHIHIPALKRLRGVEYLNTGDWVESYTAICEDYDGKFSLVTWPVWHRGKPADDVQAELSIPERPTIKRRPRWGDVLGERLGEREGPFD